MAKKKHEEHENHERWLVSYADFITLLFAFFIGDVFSLFGERGENIARSATPSKSHFEPGQQYPYQPTPVAVGDAKPKMINTDMASANGPVIRRMKEILKRFIPRWHLRCRTSRS
ncbi:MAG: hypothetical protein MRJ92_05965 [Nitrospira sp.]|nr:hypothetical protein [Nitrospira sp.]